MALIFFRSSIKEEKEEDEEEEEKEEEEQPKRGQASYKDVHYFFPRTVLKTR